MNDTVNKIIERIHELEDELQDELHRKGEALRFRIHDGTVTFEREMLLRHRALKTGLLSYIRDARWLVIATAPFIYALIVPFVLLDLFVSIYQAICFPIYQIPKVKRREYLVFDRVRLNYLNGIEKFNCAYCSYGNGIVAYVREVAARTEQYWCPIKHARKNKGAHKRYRLFTDFGDGEQYRQKLKSIKGKFEVDEA